MVQGGHQFASNSVPVKPPKRGSNAKKLCRNPIVFVEPRDLSVIHTTKIILINIVVYIYIIASNEKVKEEIINLNNILISLTLYGENIEKMKLMQ